MIMLAYVDSYTVKESPGTGLALNSHVERTLDIARKRLGREFVGKYCKESSARDGQGELYTLEIDVDDRLLEAIGLLRSVVKSQFGHCFCPDLEKRIVDFCDE